MSRSEVFGASSFRIIAPDDTPHTVAVPSAHVATILRPSREKAMQLTALLISLKVPLRRSVATSQSAMTSSELAVASNSPSGEKVKHLTDRSLIRNVCR